VFPTIKPLDVDFLDTIIGTKKKILIVEEHNIIGGLGESICAYFGQKNAANQVRHLGMPDAYSHYVGSQSYILDKFGLWATPNIKELFA
jgi:transketolase